MTAFVTSFVTPLIAAIGGKSGFSALGFTVNGTHFVYGAFLNALISFLIIAAVVFFLIVRPLNALMEHKRTEEPVAEVTRGARSACPRSRPRRAAAPSARRRSGLPELGEQAYAAQADSLAVQGDLRAPAGGASAVPRDLQLMAAGFEAPGVNSGDVTGPDPDLDAARAFYAQHGVTWGLRVPVGLPWRHGRLLFRRRLMAKPRSAFRPAARCRG